MYYDLFSPTGTLIVGTFDLVPSVARVSAWTVEDDKLVPDYTGDTECYWDGQWTESADDGVILVQDGNGDRWRLDECTRKEQEG